MVAITCMRSIHAAPEETTCYDLTPTGGDYNLKYNTPTQRINLSPWANDIRKSIGVRKAGTSQQQAKCAGLLKKLRSAVQSGMIRTIAVNMSMTEQAFEHLRPVYAMQGALQACI